MSGNRPEIPSHVLDALQVFANTTWHNPSAFRRTHHSSTSRDVEYLDLQEHTLALRFLFGSSLASKNRLLVRDEYSQALQAFQTDVVYEQGAYIIGQSGIGKTSFLIYALIERLREHKPVAVQLQTGDSFYALFAHTCTLYSSSDPTPLVQEDVWAIGDLCAHTTPLDIFRHASKVVQVILPGVKYWERWSTTHGAQMFVIDMWSKEEIADLSSLLELDVERMTVLAAKLGGVPRTLLQQCTNNKSQQNWELDRAATRVVENYATLLPGLRTLDAPDVGASPIFFLLPFKDRAGHVYRRRYIIRVPTAALQRALAISFQNIQHKDKIDIFLLMNIHPGTRACARNIYINWLLSLIAAGMVKYGNWMHTNGWITAALNIRAEQIPVLHDVSNRMEPPFYWIAPRQEFPGIDFALVTTTRIYAIQVVVSWQPPCPQVSLDKLKNLLPATSQTDKEHPYVFLFVGISEELVERASRGRPIDVRVGQGVIDPSAAGIPYKVYTNSDEYHDVDYEDE